MFLRIGDFWTRLLGYGYRFRPITEPLMLYRVHSNGVSADASMPIEEQRRHIQENSVMIVRKYRRARRRQDRRYVVRHPYINLSHKASVAQRKTVLFCLPYLVLGGGDYVFKEIIRALKDIDWDISIVTSARPDKSFGSSKSDYQELTGEIYSLPDFLKPQDTGDSYFF